MTALNLPQGKYVELTRNGVHLDSSVVRRIVQPSRVRKQFQEGLR